MKNDETRSITLGRAITATMLTSLLALTAACNTVEGAGQDIQSAGEAVEDAGD